MVVDSVQFAVEVDDRLTLRVLPVIDGAALSALFEPVESGLAGLAVGVVDVGSWPVACDSGRQPLLSCGCGAYDARVTARVSHADGLIVWTDIRDGRTGQTVPDMVFRESDYDRAIERTREQLRQMRLKYVIRVLLSIREDTGISDKEVVASASDVLLMVAAATGGFWLWGFEGMTVGVLGVFFGGALFWTMYHRRVYSPWLHPPRDQHGREVQCMFHDRRYSFLPINWFRARYS